MSQSSSLMAGLRGTSMLWWSLSVMMGSHNIRERAAAAVVPDITTGEMVPTGVAENMPEDFIPSRAGCWQWSLSKSIWLCRKSLPISLGEVRVTMNLPLWGQCVTREGDGYRKVVRPKGSEIGPHHIRKEMTAQKGDIRQGMLALGGEASSKIKVLNCKLQTVDHLINCFSSGCCPVISCLGEPRGMVGVRVAELQLIELLLCTR